MMRQRHTRGKTFAENLGAILYVQTYLSDIQELEKMLKIVICLMSLLNISFFHSQSKLLGPKME